VTDAGTGAFGTFVNGERLLRRPAQTAAFTADYRVARGSRIGAAVRVVGSRDDRDFANDLRVELPSYTLLDLSAEASLGRLGASLSHLTLTGRIENALDRAYQPSFGFSAPGRTVLLGARATLGSAAQ
jgi:outer membrane cobalamin receptor